MHPLSSASFASSAFLMDMGNTHTVFAHIHNKQIQKTARIDTSAITTEDIIMAFLSGIQFFPKEHPPTECIISSVVPEKNRWLELFCLRYLSLSPLFLTIQHAPFPICLDNPSALGMDRMVNVMGALSLYPAPFMIVDFGTATTIDVMNEDGHYLGGIITVGAELSLKTLIHKTSQLPSVIIEKPPFVLGQSTSKAIQSGIYYGYLSMIEGLIQRLMDECFPNASPKRLSTGGLGGLFKDDLNLHHHPDLSFLGMMSFLPDAHI